MVRSLNRRKRLLEVAGVLAFSVIAQRATANDIWVAPTSQQDLGGLEVASNVFWPVTPAGAVRLAWAIPGDMQTFQTAKVVLIPSASSASTTLTVFVCPAQAAQAVSASCAGPFAQNFASVANQLVELDISPVLASHLGTPGVSYVTALAYTSPSTATDHVVGLRFSYAPAIPSGVPALAANNTFSGTQTLTTGNLVLDNSSASTGLVLKGSSLFLHNSGSGNTFLGIGAGNTTLTGANNTGVGINALSAVTTGFSNAASGSSALRDNIDGFSNAAMGSSALIFNTSGSANAALGTSALFSNLTGYNNTAAGTAALYSNTSGFSNTANGFQTLFNNTTGQENTAVGLYALQSETTANLDTAVGAYALQFNMTGPQNTAIGAYSLQSNNLGFNTAVGGFALQNITGQGNIGIGQNAGNAVGAGSYNIYIGVNVPGAGNESNTMRLGNNIDITRTFLGGVRTRTTGVANAVPVLIDSNGQLGTISSSRRFKDDIRDMADVSRRLFDLRPVTFTYKQEYSDGSRPVQFGLVAEDVAAVFPELAVKDGSGNVETVHYETLSVLLLNEMQRQEKRIQEQDRRLDEMGRQLQRLLERQ